MKSTPPRVVLVLMLCASLLLPIVVSAQDDDEVTRQLGTYQLTVANVNKVKAVVDELDRRDVDAPEQEDDESFDELLKRIEKDATMSSILRGAAIAARDFVLTLTAVTAVSLASATSGDTSGKSLPPELRRHQQFINQNQAAVAPLLKTIFD